MSGKASQLLFMEPVFQNRIWGGRRLGELWGYPIPDGPVGECWAISALPEGQTKVAEGPFKGMGLAELWQSHPELFDAPHIRQFPMLVKVLDAAADLSVQVHPDDAYASAHEQGSLGKSECWYVLDAKEGARVVYGQNAHNRTECESMIKAGDWEHLLRKVPIAPGDFFQVDPGTVHAMMADTMLLETQQTSDITYRLYDYDRVQDDGSKRELHIQKALDVINYEAEPSFTPAPKEILGEGVRKLVSNSCYSVYHLHVDTRLELELSSGFVCMSVIAGEGFVDGRALVRGEHFIVPAGYGKLSLTGSMELIASHI